MTCPHCGAWAPDDPETGYAGPDLCPVCVSDGWTLTAQGELINEHDTAREAPEPVSEFDQVRR